MDFGWEAPMQTVASAAVVQRKQQHVVLTCPLSDRNIPF